MLRTGIFKLVTICLMVNTVLTVFTPITQATAEGLELHVPFHAGTKHNLIQGWNSEHTAYDFGNSDWITGKMDLDILTAAPGVVIDVVEDRTGSWPGITDARCLNYNNYIEIRHDDGSRTMYSHIATNSARFNVGDRVNYGDVIATMGDVGCAEGIHLHYNYWNSSGRPTEPTFVEQPIRDGRRIFYISQNSPRPVGIAPTITSSGQASVGVGQTLTHTFVAQGDPPPALSYANENLPAGVTRTGDTLSGTPTTAGTYTIDVKASNGVSPEATQTFRLIVTGDAPLITSVSTATTIVGNAWTHTFTFAGSPAPTLTFSNASLPPGIVLQGNTLSGVAEAVGEYSVLVTASNGAAPDATQVFTLTVYPVPPAESGAAAVPPPPGVALCIDHNFEGQGVVRASVPEQFAYALNCRVLIQDGAIPTWLGAQMYNLGSIGDRGMIDMGIIQAVDVFSPVGIDSFHDAVICLRGTGRIFQLDDTLSHAARISRESTVYTVPEWAGFTCVTLYKPSTLVLVADTRQ